MSAVSAVRSTFNALKGELSKIYHLGSVSSVLAYDEQVFMPHNQRASQFRGQQNATIAGISHDLATSQKLGEMINELVAEKAELNEKEQVVVRLAKRDFDRKTKIPKELVEEEATLSSEGYQTWVKARQTSDFAAFAPTLKKWIELRKKIAACLDPSRDVYDVLVDEFERDLSTERLDQIFGVIREKLVPLSKKIIEAAQKKKVDSSIILSTTEQFPIAAQEAMNKKIAAELGFNFEEGRMDVSVHPFSIGISIADVRITTRYKTSEFLQGMSGTIHETGHALYENGLPRDFEGTPLARAVGMGVHESQSLLWERHVGLSKPFWKKYWPVVQETFPHLKAQEDFDTVFAAINEVVPSLIRVEADEVTYPMHILVRYEIERDLFKGVISVDELPTVWNQKMKEYLGVVPSKDAEGVLQDIHWSSGAFGYFPTYLIGQILAAQIFNSAKKQIPDLEAGFEKGEFNNLKLWLNQNIHAHGAQYNVDQLIQQVTGEPINPNYLVEYLETKYTSIFSA